MPGLRTSVSFSAPPPRARKPVRGETDGFALIVSLSLMAVVVLAVVLLAGQLRLALSDQNAISQKVLDRQYALLGASLAMSQIQTALGPDEVVSARAGMTGTDSLAGDALPESTRMWTGAWPTEGPDLGSVRWLVSGEDPTPDSADGVFLLPPEDDSLPSAERREPVSVPVMDLPPLGSSSGSVAWWVGDEGVKASMSMRDPVVEALGVDPDWMSHEPRVHARQMRHMQSQRFGLELLFDGMEPDMPGSLAWRDAMNILPSQDTHPAATSSRYYHDLTPMSYGVLSKPGKNGLQADFSLSPNLLGDEFSAWQEYDAYMIHPPDDPLQFYSSAGGGIEDLRRRYRITAPPENVGEGNIVHSVSPVLTDFLISFGVFRRTSINDFRLRVRIHVELWNPYTSALLPEDLRLVIYGLPTIQIFRDGTSLTNSIDLRNVLTVPGDPDDAISIELPFDSQPFPNNDSRSWLPGRVYNWTIRTGAPETPPLLSQFYERNAWSRFQEIGVPGQFYPSPGVTRPFSVETSGPVRIALELQDSDGNPLQRIEDAEFDAIRTPTGSSTKVGPRFGFRLRIIESGDLGEDESVVSPEEVRFAKGEWLMNNDPRSFSQTVGNIDEGDAYFLPNGTDPTSYTDSNPGHKVSQPTHLFDRIAGATGLRPMEDVPLFELPRQALQNVGQLQSLQIEGQRPNSIGNSWGSSGAADLNQLFEEGFFSGFTTDSLDWSIGETLPNPRFVPSPLARDFTTSDFRADAERSGERFLIRGPFNINSDSVEAWRSLLGSSNLVESVPSEMQWTYVNKNDLGPNGGDINTANPFVKPAPDDSVNGFFTRFPQSIHETYYLGTQNSAIEPPTEFFRRGTTNLFSDDFDHTQRLAEQIVARSRQVMESNGRPFHSLSEFLEPQEIFEHPYAYETARMSIIERAILDLEPAMGLNRFGGNDVWWLSPMFFSQADFLAKTASFLRTRSDTFRVRVRGSSQRMGTGDRVSSSVLELFVQRLPEPVLSGDSALLPDPSLPGRRFTVVSFEWMDEE